MTLRSKIYSGTIRPAEFYNERCQVYIHGVFRIQPQIRTINIPVKIDIGVTGVGSVNDFLGKIALTKLVVSGYGNVV